ncbi:nucleotidyltransferase domain-containing protein [Cereibacter sphaeroides]|nr:nucleotidyltransferase domain-containing protein [Cereibacter sphaeroides]MCE6958042.1 nucleotidyltransferase domain-containing protein [Cereibacter sphaeroides]MCE6971365.1 nucleotidyltransferase domain-containing protein [Cereibacter sphaeroides]
MERILGERIARRKALLDRAADRVRQVARTKGVEVRFFGSYADGFLDAESDLDVLVMGNLDSQVREDIFSALERATADLDVVLDLIEAQRAPHLVEGSIP